MARHTVDDKRRKKERNKKKRRQRHKLDTNPTKEEEEVKGETYQGWPKQTLFFVLRVNTNQVPTLEEVFGKLDEEEELEEQMWGDFEVGIARKEEEEEK